MVRPRSRPRWTYSSKSVVWSYPISIWAQEKWNKDETNLFIKCFENDWSLITDKLPKNIRENEVEKAKIKLAVKEF